MKTVLKGRLKTKHYTNKELQENLNVIVYNPETKNNVEVSKLSHITDYQWITDKGTVISPDLELHYMVAKCFSTDNEYIVKDNQWANYLDKIGDMVAFHLLDSEFKTGIWMMECTNCSAHFMGSKSQGLCEACSEINKVAKILSAKDKPRKKLPIFTTEKKLTIGQVKQFAGNAFDAGRFSKQSFEDWFSKQDF